MALTSNVCSFSWIENQDSVNCGYLRIIDQLKLPESEVYIELKSHEDVARAIKRMEVRGAPAIGIVAAFGMLFRARQAINHPETYKERMLETRHFLASTRPTAVNLFWALDEMWACVEKYGSTENALEALFNTAMKIWENDLAMNRAIAEHGANAIGRVKNVLTHCNTGSLATSGLGTALGVIRELNSRAQKAGEPFHVWVDETRPYLQGARLTAWELMKDDIACTLITDNMAAYFMQQSLVDAVIVGADRIAKNGDIANKIGTYGLAILAQYHKIPFYVAAPESTFDDNITSLDEIPIEERSPEEVISVKGQRIAPEGVQVRHPAFDLTPHHLITGIIAPNGVLRYND